jgi:hypothetical protein
MEMSTEITLNTVKNSNGELLTGKLWRKNHELFNDLPFHTDIPRMDEIAGPLQKALEEGSLEVSYRALLVVRPLSISFHH